MVCRGCLDENYTYCEHCNEYCHNDDAVHIEDADIYVCCDCANNSYYRCEDCNDYYEHLNTTSYESYVCESCLENYECCDDCNEYFTSDDITDGYCEDCKPEAIPEQNENDTRKLPFEESIRNAE